MTTLLARQSKADDLAHQYQVALNRYLKNPSKAKPAAALRLGRDAVALGMGTLALAAIHEQAMTPHLIPDMPSSARNHLHSRAGNFFAETLAPIEATQQAAMLRYAKLIQLNETLDQQTRTLVASNQKLESEIAKRKVVEDSLRESERRTKQLLEQSHQLQTELRDLSHRILSSQEDERKRISRELHDLVAQTLTGINLHLATLKTEAENNVKGMTKNIARTQKLVEKSVDAVHQFARQLRPALLDDLGLIPALHSFTKDFAKETGLRVNISAFAGIEKISATKRIVLYRVAQEALTNVARHARASQVAITIEQEQDSVCMKIKDDGQSFDVEKLLHDRKNKRLGLLGMRERVEMVGGTFSIESAPGSGTTVTAHVPFQIESKEPPQS